MARLEGIVFAIFFLAGFVGGCASERSPLAEVAREVRADMTYTQPDNVWRADCSSGDCEDFALCAIVRLRQRGINARIGVYEDPVRGPHAVAVVSSEHGDWLIDNGKLRSRGDIVFAWEGELRGGKVWRDRILGNRVYPHVARSVSSSSRSSPLSSAALPES